MPMTRAPASPERAALHDLLARHQRFLLTTHVNPDGDAIGSEVAFAALLKAKGRPVRVLNDSPTPQAFGWLERGIEVETHTEEIAEQRLSRADALVVVVTGKLQP